MKEKEISIIVDAQNKAKGAFADVKRGIREMNREASKGTSDFERKFQKMDKVVLSFSDRLQFIDKIAKRTFQGTAAAAGIYVAATLRDFSQLEDGISKVNTLYDQTSQSQEKMIKDSLQMYKLIPSNFESITQGIYDTISAGANADYASMFARKFGVASVAGMTEMPIVTKAAMGTMNAFKKEAQDLNHILDVQFLTVKNGITEYGELASALGTGVLSSAESAGISMEELYAAIAQITKNAIPASVATTSLVQMFNKFTDTKALEEFKEFGVSIRDSNGETRNLVEIMKDLNEEFDRRGMNKEARASYLKEILGSDEAVRALQPLLGDVKEFSRILDDMKGSSGAMQDAFDDRIENMGTQLKILWNNIKAFGVENFLAFKPLVDALTGPLVMKQKLEMQKLDLQDEIRLVGDDASPANRKMMQFELERIEQELNSLDLTPMDQFKSALDESVENLRSMNPLLAEFVETIGNFVFQFLGDEGQETRDEILTWAKRAGYVYAGKKAIDLYRWSKPILNTGKKILNTPVGGEKTGGGILGTGTYDISANIVNVYGDKIGSGTGKGAGAGGVASNSKSSKTIGTVLKGAVGSVLKEAVISGGMVATASAGYLGTVWLGKKVGEYDPTIKGNQAAKDRGNVNKLVDLKNQNMYNESFDTKAMQEIIDIVTAIAADETKNKEQVAELSNKLHDTVSKSIKQGKTELLDTGNSTITQYIIDEFKGIREAYNQKILSDIVSQKKIYTIGVPDEKKSSSNFLADLDRKLIEQTNALKAFERKEFKVDFPNINVNVKLDSQGNVVSSSSDYDKITIQAEREARRYGKLYGR